MRVALAFLLLLPLSAQKVPPQASCKVDGQVIDSQTSLPVPDAVVTIYNKHARRLSSGVMAITGTTVRPPEQSPEDDPRSVTADVQGRFAFSGLEPGIYVMAASHPGYRLTPYRPYNPESGGTIELQPGDTKSGLVIRISPQSAIAGHVRDEEGLPVAGAEVMAGFLRGRQLAVRSTAVTNSRGEYRIPTLDEGSYYVRVAPPAGETNADKGTLRSYLPAFHPSSRTLSGAQAVEVGEGREYTADVTLPRGQPSSIRGTISAPPKVTGVSVHAMSMEFGTVAGSVGQTSEGHAAFAIGRLNPGAYVLHAVGSDAGQAYEAWMPVRVESAGLTGIELNLAAPVDVGGRIEVHGAPGVKLSGLRFQLEGKYSDRGAVPVSVHGDGTFLAKGVPPDVYWISPRATGNGYIQAVELSGVDVSGSGIDLTQTPFSGELVLVLNAGGGAIRGTVVDERGAGVAGALIRLAPLDPPTDSQRTRWATQLTAPDLKGRYGFGGIPPGTYRLQAFKPGNASRMYDAAFLKQFESWARVVEVIADYCESVELKAIP